MIDVIILAGGLGTRLASVVHNLPKALAPIQGVPFFRLLLNQCIKQRDLISKVVIALGHQADKIKSFLHSISTPFPIEFSLESSPLGTGGAILLALSKTSSKTLLILNGDSFSDVSFNDFLSYHRAKQASLSIVCRWTDDCSRYGSIQVDQEQQRILCFLEKSPTGGGGWVSAGIYLIERELFAPFSSGVYSIERDFFPTFLYRRVYAFAYSGTFIDIGTPDSYAQAQELLQPWIDS